LSRAGTVWGARLRRAPGRLDRVLDELRAWTRARLAPPELDLGRLPREAFPLRCAPEVARGREALVAAVLLAEALPDRPPVDRDRDFAADPLREGADAPLRAELARGREALAVPVLLAEALPDRPPVDRDRDFAADPLRADVLLREEAFAAPLGLDEVRRAVDRGRAEDPLSPACLRFAKSITLVRPLCWRS